MTAYAMRISDWSSDVCSSDLNGYGHPAGFRTVVDETRFAARAEPAHVPAHQAVDQADERRSGDQRQREHQDQQAHKEGQRREGRGDQVALGPDIDLADVIAEVARLPVAGLTGRSEAHTSELQSLMRMSYTVFCLPKKIRTQKSK